MKFYQIYRYLLLAAVLILSVTVTAQVPQLLNFQAVARDASGNEILNENLTIRIAIIQDNPSGTVLWEEEHEVPTNEFGLFTLQIGDPAASKSDGTLNSFAEIDWLSGPLYIRPSIYYNSSWYQLPASRAVSTPYSLVAGDVASKQFEENADTLYFINGSLSIGSDSPGGSSLAVVSTDDSSEDALFEVKRNDGQTVFAVYPEAVRMYVSTGTAKGPKGGFAIGGFDRTKQGSPMDLLWVTPDSIRLYIENESSGEKSIKGGFAIGGFDRTKTERQDLMTISLDSTRIYINDTGTKGPKGGFAIGGFDRSKAGGNSYLNVSGKADAEVINPGDSRVLWYPLKEAFLTGRVLIESPDSVGTNSMATGFESKAIGDYSQAMGYQAVARGDYSTSIGNQTTASGLSSFAFGDASRASGPNSFAFGKGSIANGDGSYSFGLNCSATSTSSIAMGNGSLSNANYAFSAGKGATASNTGATAIGNTVTASGASSSALGYSTNASGNYSTATGYNTTASGTYSTAMGYSSTASAQDATAIGRSCSASGTGSVAFGMSNVSNNFYAVSIGYSSTASGQVSTAIGRDATASATNSVAIGYISKATAAGATAIGQSAEANGTYSFAGGYQSNGDGYGSVSLGNNTTSTNQYSSAIGFWSQSKADRSVAIGYNVVSTSYESFVCGAYNIEMTADPDSWVDTDPLFVIGNGYNSRSNAVTVLKNGNFGIGTINPAGKLDVNGSIYQRGSVLHADYVFEEGYELEPIEEHSCNMWADKHLPAVPGIKYDEEGQEIIEWGARNRGMLEELEKAHIYIEQLNTKLKSQQDVIEALQNEIDAIKKILNN